MPDFFEIINAQRAIRRFKPDPVPQLLIEKLIEYATKAPSGSNKQPWAFVIVTEQDKKNKIAHWYHEGWVAVYESDPSRPRNAVYESALHLANHLHDVPVLIFPCITESNGRVPSFSSGASIYPAAQNLMLAATALGLGSVITTFHRRHENDVKALLGIPEEFTTSCMIPIGWPAEGEHFGGSKRKPVSEVIHYENW
ncbi:MAG: nitroreductase [Chloroflexi bacterium]|nr:nitroreductase [Chloroflexota bacterium]MQF86586.1 nitroreductase family protein [SAR202 cluster bacterium]|tara:strand:- start:117 stop:707 length:591 start_codon:yes stop_codon:yes gene_type:complete